MKITDGELREQMLAEFGQLGGGSPRTREERDAFLGLGRPRKLRDFIDEVLPKKADTSKDDLIFELGRELRLLADLFEYALATDGNGRSPNSWEEASRQLKRARAAVAKTAA